jgi:hypothetical protein
MMRSRIAGGRLKLFLALAQSGCEDFGHVCVQFFHQLGWQVDQKLPEYLDQGFPRGNDQWSAGCCEIHPTATNGKSKARPRRSHSI